MPLLPDQLDDFVNLTLDNFKKRRWVDISLDNQHHIFASKMFKAKGKDPEKGGVQLNWKIQVTNTGTAKNSELYAVDATGVKDLTQQAKQQWSKQTVNFSYDIDEDAMQSDRETIIREIEVREHSMYNDFFEHMEEAMWSAPSSSTVSPRPPSGVPFWIQKSTTTPGGGFTGGNPSGFTSGAGGLSSSTYSNWKNWAFNYTSVSRDDCLAKWRKAIAFTNFQAPRNYAELARGGESDWGFYTNYDVVEKLEKLLEGRNDNLGVDLAKYAGSAVFKGNPVVWVPYLQTNDTSDPIYGVNWRTLRYFFRKGKHMVRHAPQKAARQHTVREIHMDNWGNFVCYNRRRNFIGYVA